ncbi:EAL domain-containing protein [Paenibacillus sp. MMO-58]|uniref:EAL domain-containing protein n=1 Tax=Paenibacillus sp. MMO-58 TaxID=3081290 RepID=UPI0030166A93
MEWYMCYQPIIDVVGGNVLGYEALVRSPSGKKPMDLFKAAARQNKAVDLDQAIIQQVIHEGEELLLQDELLFINVRTEISLKGIKVSVPLASRTIFEMTEKMALTPSSRRTIEQLSDEGIRFAIDDYGRGYSNLDRFVQDWFSPSIIKLDRLFTQRMASDKRAYAIVKQTVQFCMDAGLQLIVEGVETAKQRDMLLACGVRYMQGYFFGMPATKAHWQAARWLKQNEDPIRPSVKNAQADFLCLEKR